MALKVFPALLHAQWTPRSSRIPHLVFALTSKHNQIRARLRLRRQQSISRSTASHAALPSVPPPPPPPPPLDRKPGSTPTPPPPSQRDRWALSIASLFGFSLALYLSFIYVGVRKDLERSQRLLESGTLSADGDVSDRWDAIGRKYDDEIDVAEKVMFMGRKRARLVRQARGQVLEVSVGTGRNMAFYNLEVGAEEEEEEEVVGKMTIKKKKEEEEERESRVTGLVFNDKAGVMVQAARRKFEELEGRKGSAKRFRGRVEFVVGDAGVEGVVERPAGPGGHDGGGGFDTIVQTMGLCSTKDPVAFLKRLGELCRKPSGKKKADGRRGVVEQATTRVAEGKYGKEAVGKKGEDDDTGGRILLLEHGRGYYDWLNKVLDGLAPAHADHYGCWWNRDIGRIVEESGLEVEYIKRYHVGTTWEVVLKPKREPEVVVAAESDSGMFGWMPKAANRIAEAISWR